MNDKNCTKCGKYAGDCICPDGVASGSLQQLVRHPTFDADGYPTEETELAIKAWDFRDVDGWLAYIREAWNHHYGRMWEEGGLLKLATGGWSGNESITHAMRENYILWSRSEEHTSELQSH